MNRSRHYFISESMNELELLQQQLQAAGITIPQIHLLTLEDEDAENRESVHDVTSLMKTNVVHSWQIGSLVGVCAAAIVLLSAYFFGWASSEAGWIPFIFLAVVLLGFCTWEMGLHGIQRPNRNFERFQSELKSGKHILFVDVAERRNAMLDELIRNHPRVESAGTGTSTYSWILFLQRRLPGFFRETLP